MKYTTRQIPNEEPMTTISLRMPQTLVEELKAIAPKLGFSGYQPLIRAYVGQGLQADQERLKSSQELDVLLESLRSRGVSESVLGSAVAEARAVYQVQSMQTVAPINRRMRKEQELSWQAFVAATYGSFAEAPLERSEQGLHEEREVLR
ncbi:MAG: hypothetical protein U0175_15990 [Caldilineaceae bacterium]